MKAPATHVRNSLVYKRERSKKYKYFTKDIITMSYWCHTNNFMLKIFKNWLCCQVVPIPVFMSMLPRRDLILDKFQA